MKNNQRARQRPENDVSGARNVVTANDRGVSFAMTRWYTTIRTMVEESTARSCRLEIPGLSSMDEFGLSPVDGGFDNSNSRDVRGQTSERL